MKTPRIEELLRTKPDDEPVFGSQLDIDAVEPRRLPPAARRFRAPAMAGLSSAAIVVIAIVLAGVALIVRQPAAASPEPTDTGSQTAPVAGVIPWVAATPPPSPTPEPTPVAGSLPPCSADELVLDAEGWGGATGSMAGGATVVNLGANACRVESQVPVVLTDADGNVIAAGGNGSTSDTTAVAVPSGAGVGTIVVWMNWCGPEPKRPLALTLAIPNDHGSDGISAIVNEDRGGPGLPRCDAPGADSTIGMVGFAAAEPTTSDYAPEACDAAGLAAYSGTWGAGLGSSYTELVVLNRGGVDCLLPTSPTVELRDAEGALLRSTQPWPDGPTNLLLPAGWTAVARIAFANWCFAVPTLPMRMDLVVGGVTANMSHPSSEMATIPVPGCMSAPETPPPVLDYDSPFVVPGTPISEPDPIDTLPVTVKISPVPVAHPGSVLEFSVALTNVTPFGKPLNLAAFCPTYTESVSFKTASGEVRETYELNCAAAGILGPDQSLTFAMRLAIPADAPTGIAGLIWQLGQRGPADKAPFQIVP